MRNFDMASEFSEQMANLIKPIAEFAEAYNRQMVAHAKPIVGFAEAYNRQMVALVKPMAEFAEAYNRQMVALTKPIAGFAEAYNRQIVNLDSFKPILSRLSEITNAIDTIGLSIPDMIRQANFSSIAIREDGLYFEDEIVDSDELIAKLDSEIAKIKKSGKINSSFCRKSLSIVIYLLPILITWFFAMYPDTMRSLGESTSRSISSAIGAETHAFTINEKTLLREAPDGRADTLSEIPIETRLRVVSSAPRWYEVEYIAEDGSLIIGWVAKRNVDTVIDWFSAFR